MQFHYKSMAWHPNVATQVLIGNEDDRYPVIQVTMVIICCNTYPNKEDGKYTFALIQALQCKLLVIP